MKEYYKILGLNPGAPPEVIKAAFRALMKIHHPDVGGDPEKAKEIEKAYRYLTSAMVKADTVPVQPQRSEQRARGHLVRVCSAKGKYLEVAVLELLPNQVFACPRECSFYRRSCRFKQQLSLVSQDQYALRATTLLVQMRNPENYSQQIDCRNGRSVLVDQLGDFYNCTDICTWLHPPAYKGARVEMFPGTRATIMLWFPQLPAGRYITRFFYKHKVLVRDVHGDWLDEELMEMALA